jgi:hypothetical protein
MSTDKQSSDSPADQIVTAPPSDPRVRAFCDALAKAVAKSVLEDIRAGRLPELLAHAEKFQPEPPTLQRAALSVRGIEREYGVSRTRVMEAIRAGEVAASRLGSRRYSVLRTDFEAWLRRQAIRPTSHAEQRVAEILAREERKRGGAELHGTPGEIRGGRG